MTATHECAHEPCSCQIPLDRTYCSERCSSEAVHEGVTCGCGHRDCAGYSPIAPDESTIDA